MPRLRLHPDRPRVPACVRTADEKHADWAAGFARNVSDAVHIGGEELGKLVAVDHVRRHIGGVLLKLLDVFRLVVRCVQKPRRRRARSKSVELPELLRERYER